MAEGGEVKGRVEMPDACSPSVSPAVVTLVPVDGSKVAEAPKVPGRVALRVNQHGLQFEPRVGVIRVGQTLQFTNQDAETHNVHILTPGFPFNRSMAPNVPADFVPGKPGVIRLTCDIHSHMRGFVVVTDSPWAKVCKGGGAFRFADVPEGRYHPERLARDGRAAPAREVEVKGGGPVDLGSIVLKGYPVAATAQANAAPVRPWPEVTDRIGVLLAEARECLAKPGGAGPGPEAGRGRLLGRVRDLDDGDRRPSPPGDQAGRGDRRAIPRAPLGDQGGRRGESPGRPSWSAAVEASS